MKSQYVKTETLTLGVLGAGRLGCGIANALSSLGYGVLVYSRTNPKIPLGSTCSVMSDPQTLVDRSDLVFLTVSDDAIELVAKSIAWRSGQRVVHCSGSLPLTVLSNAKDAGASTGSFWPLQTFPDYFDSNNRFEGITVAIEAEDSLMTELSQLAESMGAWWISMRSDDRILCHISAVLACGAIAAILQMASDLWNKSQGQSQVESPNSAIKALYPLAKSTVEAVNRMGFPSALTGPFARGDLRTVSNHLEILGDTAPHAQVLYCHLALAQLSIAGSGGQLASQKYHEIEQMIHRALGNHSF